MAKLLKQLNRVSTHSRLKAAGAPASSIKLPMVVSTHSRLKAAGDDINQPELDGRVSTHSRLKAAGPAYTEQGEAQRFQHTAA